MPIVLGSNISNLIIILIKSLHIIKFKMDILSGNDYTVITIYFDLTVRGIIISCLKSMDNHNIHILTYRAIRYGRTAQPLM